MFLSGPPTLSNGAQQASVAGWLVESREVVDSTQDLARAKEPWCAVIAMEQLRGRGQAGRTFVSNPGGLYLSAVVPFDGGASRWKGLALAVGWALRETLRRAGFQRIRLRWPNDLMIGSSKVGGILLEQASPTTMIVGIGINLTNRPWLEAPELKGISGRLVDFKSEVPPRCRFVELILRAIRAAHVLVNRQGFARLVPAINRSWGRTRRLICLDLAVGSEEGTFSGVDAEGCLKLVKLDGTTSRWSHVHVNRLRELE